MCDLTLNDLKYKRTEKSYSGQLNDLILEQTINVDTDRKLIGITYLRDLIAVRQRWSRSNDIRSTIITYVLEEQGP